MTPPPPPVPRRGRLTSRQRARLTRWVLYGMTAVLVAAIVVYADWGLLARTFADPEIFADLFPEIVTVAAKNTLLLAVFSFTGGVAFGLVLALMRLSSVRFYRWLALSYIEFFRGIPALLTLILIGFVLPIALGVRSRDFLPFLGDKAAPVVGLSVVASAYLAETIRAGIEAVPRGQMEAARSLGMSRAQAMISIIIPQAFRVMIPPLTNEFVLLIKDSSLLFVLGVAPGEEELAFFSRAAVQRTFNGTPFIAAALLYLAITLPLTSLSRRLESRGAKAARKRA